jgi:integration host factor subunit beta
MTKRDLIDEIVRQYPAYSRRDAEVIVNAVFESMTEALCSGERIEIRGFGSFVVKHRRSREGRNPKTGEIVAVAAKRVPFFKVGKELKQRVDGDASPPSSSPTSPASPSGAGGQSERVLTGDSTSA